MVSPYLDEKVQFSRIISGANNLIRSETSRETLHPRVSFLGGLSRFVIRFALLSILLSCISFVSSLKLLDQLLNDWTLTIEYEVK